MTTTFLTAPPRPTHCCVCGEPLEFEASGEPVWTTAYPDMAHERCVDWSERPFPYAWRLQQLRDARRVIVDSGRWLAAVEKRWPHGAREALAEWRERHAAVVRVVQKLV